MSDEPFPPPTLRQLIPPPDPAVDPAVDPAAAYAFPDGDGPWLRTNFVASVDGAATIAGRSGPLGNSTDKNLFAMLRALADVILVGAGTARQEGYGPAEDDPAFRHLRAGRPATAPLAIVTRRAEFDLTAPLFTAAPADARTIVIAPAKAGRDRLAAIGERADVIVAGAEAVDLAVVVHELAARGHRRISCEGGPRLHADLVAADLVDELCLTISPVVACGDGPGITHGPALDPPRGMRLAGLLADGDYLFARYGRHR